MSSSDEDPLDELYDEAVEQTEEREGLASRLLERHIGYKSGVEEGGISISQFGIFNKVIINEGDIEGDSESTTTTDKGEEPSTESEETRRSFLNKLGTTGAGLMGAGVAAGAGYAVIDGMEYDFVLHEDESIEDFLDNTMYSNNEDLRAAANNISEAYEEDGNYKLFLENGILENNIGLLEEGNPTEIEDLSDTAYREAKTEARKY